MANSRKSLLKALCLPVALCLFAALISVCSEVPGNGSLKINATPSQGGEVFCDPPGPDYANGTVVVIKAEAKPNYRFSRWSGSGNITNPADDATAITINGDMSVTANFENTCALTTNISPVGGGTVSRQPNEAVYVCGTNVTVTARAADGYRFDRWSGSSTSTDPTVRLTVNNYGNNNTMTLTANFIRIYTLTAGVTSNGGGTVSRNPSLNTYDAGTQVTVTATPSAGYRFDRWSGSSTSTNPTVTVSMDGNKSLTASFIRIYSFSTDVTPYGTGTVSRNPNQDTYDVGTRVTVTATPASGYRFDGWSGASSSTSASVTITMDGDKYLTASFVRTVSVSTQSITVYPAGGGSVSLNPNQARYDYGTQVTATATPASGYRFDRWSGKSQSTNPTISFTMTDDLDLTANFIRVYTLTVNMNPASGGGSVWRSSNEPRYDAGTQVTVTAYPESNYRFAGWTGASTSTDQTIYITMDANKTLTARFELIRYTLTTNEEPVGGGTVSRSPSQPTGGYVTGTQVTLTATPANGYEFVRWSGTCYYYSSNTSAITFNMYDNCTQTAEFKQKTYTLSIVTEPTNGGTVEVNGMRSYGTTTHGYRERVTVIAMPASGYKFVKWVDITSSNPWDQEDISTFNILNLTIDGDWRLRAVFEYGP